MKPLLLFVFLIFSISITNAGDLTGKTAPDFSAKDTEGKDITLSDFRGKVVLLDFWATWCVPCNEEFPYLVKFYESHQKDDFIILAVNIDNKEEHMDRFLRKCYAEYIPNAKFPVIYDKDKKIPPLFDLQSMPTTIFIDKKGVVRYIHTGFNDSRKKEFREELDTLLHEKG
jgi:thiol-disulfide isomerase/thioredoxin